MWRSYFQASVLGFLFFWVSQALALGLIVWTPIEGGPRLVLPRLDGETPTQAVLRYEKAVNSNPNTKKLVISSGPLVSSDGVLNLPTYSLQEVRDLSVIKPPSFLIVANEFEQMVKGADKESSPQVFSHLERLGADTYMLPVMPDIGLSEKDSTEFYEKTARGFDANFHLGGEDIDPSLYGQPNTHSINTNIERDISELKGLKIKLKSESGVVYGVCRGHQLCAIAHGHELVQDIPSALGVGTAEPNLHNNKTLHKIKINRNSFLYFLTGLDEMWANSFHHQAVLEKLNSSFRSAAVNTDGPSVMEAAELANGRGFTFQFHPELANLLKGNEPENFGIMRLLVNYAKHVREIGPPNCFSESLRHALLK